MTNRIDDSAQIAALMSGWLHRDLNRWDELLGLFHPDAEIEITWFRGRAADFVAGSRRMSGGPFRSRHLIGAPEIRFAGRRALVETPAVIVVQHKDLHLGATTHSRFLDQVEQRDGRWAIVARHASYDLSSFDFPRGPVALDLARLDAHPAEYAPLAYLLETAGFPVKGPFPTRFSGQEAAIREQQARWLSA